MKVLDTVEREFEADAERFATPVTDDQLASKRKKKYVFSEFFKYVEPN